MPSGRGTSDFNHYLLTSQQYDMIYRQKLLEQLKNQGVPIDNPNVFIGLNSNL
jgi:GH35 family endo-1,4-beta-xylanase